MNVPPEEELVDALDPQGNVVGTVTRAEMRAANLWHRSVFVVVVTLVSRCWAVTSAPARIAPEESLSRPLTLPKLIVS